MSVRTIHRDIKFLKEAGFRIDRVASGVYTATLYQLKGVEMLDDDELSFFIASKRLVRWLFPKLEHLFDAFWGRITDSFYPSIYISAEIPQTLSDSTLKSMRNLIGYISSQREVLFRCKDECNLRKVEPHKLAYLKGFWYLIGKDQRDLKLKAYAIDRITSLSATKRKFAVLPQVEEMVQKLCYPYLTDRTRRWVRVKVDKEVAHYFKRKRFDPTQKIENEFDSGDLIVSFLADNTDPIKNFIVKPWVPYVLVLDPSL